MTDYLNPFYARAAEQQRDAHQFVSTFGSGVLDILPDEIWDRLVVIRSSPGAGKTSLMRLFTAENLLNVCTRQSGQPVHRQLSEKAVIDDDGPLKLGVLIDLDRDYRSLLDLNISDGDARRLFLRLLDVRILVGVMRGALTVAGKSFPDDVSLVNFLTPADDARTDALIDGIGGPLGGGVLAYARRTEREILALLNALVAADVEMVPEGHNELYSLAILANSVVEVDGTPVTAQPLLMFDDGHRLAASQREVLLEELKRRHVSVARWYAERLEALSNQELMGGIGSEGRDVLVLNLDEIARAGDGRRFQRNQYDRVLTDIARKRAAVVLATYAQESQPFLELVDEDLADALGEREQAAIASLRSRVLDATGGSPRYEGWFKAADSLRGFAAATRWRELEVLVLRDQNRQQDLFEAPLSSADLDSRSSASLREAAALAVANEFKTPYYAGSNDIVRLGAHNAHQFLDLCGDLFAEMLVDVSLGRPPRLNVARQHRVLKAASERFWESIPRTVPHGRDVQAVVREIVEIARVDNAKPTMPYPPGVTGTAVLMSERSQLLEPEYRERHPAAQRLFDALGSALAFNILQADIDYSVKGSRYMVLYLNRLLCPRFGLPLGLGGFRERRLSVMQGWMQKLPAQATRRSQATGERTLGI